jgi:hypothetical protein
VAWVGGSGPEWYLYWKLPAAEAAVAVAALRLWQDALRRQHPGLQARLLRRSDEREPGQQTWMETYRHPDGMAPGSTLGRLIREEGDALLAAHGAPRRHLEVFLDPEA